MKPDEFICNLKAELQARGDLYLNEETEVSILIESMGLDESQNEVIKKIIRLLIEETAYGLICGIEGAASIGSKQEVYKLISESGEEITGSLDALFYEDIIENKNT